MSNATDNPKIEVLKAGGSGVFTNYIYKAIPLAFDESMSYYETLAGLRDYLEETVIPTVNNNAEAVAELQGLYEELNKYVDDYFKNLDVQEEINNKLDAMVEDGTFASILLNYTQITKTFDTYNDMMLDTSTYVNGMKLKTLGYHFINDGGGAEYFITNVQNDNKYQISIGTNLWVELIIKDSANVKQFGAYGDGVNDDSASIQNAINTGKNIYFPSSNYLISNTLLINGRNNWKLDSSEATITYTGNNYAIEFRTIRNSNLYIGVISARNGGCISVIGDSGSQYSQYVNIDFNTLEALTNCIYVENNNDCWISEFRVNKGRFAKGENGYYIIQNSKNGLSHWVFNNIGIEGVDVGFNFKIGEYAQANNHYIDSFEFNECRSGEAKKILKNDGIIRKFLWLSSHYVTPNQFDLTSDCTFMKFIHAERTNYIYNGILYERSIDVTDKVTPSSDITITDGKVRMTDDLAIIHLSVKGAESDISLQQNQLILSGLPKPKENIIFIAQNYGDNTQMQPRFMLTTAGELHAYWPGSAKIPSGNYATFIDLAYFKNSME